MCLPKKIVHRVKKEKGILSLILQLLSRRPLNNIIYFSLVIVRVWINNVCPLILLLLFLHLFIVLRPYVILFIYLFLSFLITIYLSYYLYILIFYLFLFLLLSCTNCLGINRDNYLNFCHWIKPLTFLNMRFLPQ